MPYASRVLLHKAPTGERHVSVAKGKCSMVGKETREPALPWEGFSGVFMSVSETPDPKRES